MKTCSKCKVGKPLEDFHISCANKDGRTYECKACTKARRESRSSEKKAEEAARSKAKRERRSPEQVAIDREKARLYHIDKCLGNPAYFRKQNAAWVAGNPTAYLAIQRRHWLKKYGLTIAQYEAMLVKQKFQCAICKAVLDNAVKNSVHIDHCHTTNEVRGILCLGCNTGIGKLKDSPALLRAAAEYIEQQTTLIQERLYLGNFI